MKTIHFSLSLLILCSSFLMGCRKGGDGAPGPAGAPGSSGEDNLNKQGSISGTLYYNYYNTYTSENDTLMIPFKYEYYDSEARNVFNTYVDVQTQQTIHRYQVERREPKDAESFMNIVYNFGSIPIGPVPSDFDIYFNLSHVMSSNTHFGFSFSSNFDGSPDNSDLIVTNYSFNSTTGDLSFNYEIDIDPVAVSIGRNMNTSARPRLKGSVNVTMKKSLGSSY